MILYNCKCDQGAKSYGKAQWIIAKFDEDLNVEATYLVTASHCTCPAWLRKNKCKHQDILEKFRWREYVDTEWFYNAGTGGWHRPLQAALEAGSTPFPSGRSTAVSALDFDSKDDGSNPSAPTTSPSDPVAVPCPGSEAAEGLGRPLPSAVSFRRRPIK